VRTVHPRRQDGATLVELLVALSIGVMIVAVVMLAHRALTDAASRESGRLREQELARFTIETLRGDLQQLFLPGGDPGCVMELEQTATNLVRLSFCRWTTVPARDALPTNRLERVNYRFADVDGKPQLIVELRPLTGPDAEKPARTNWPGPAWPRLLIQLHDGGEWRTNWPADAASAPRAARIQLLSETAAPRHEALVLIPAGMSVTSRLSRAGASAIAPP